ncbi:MAG: M28 family peptidase [Phycisphaerales bacterium]|nr:M28 family peptidase [Phycisphaerales bacterium]
MIISSISALLLAQTTVDPFVASVVEKVSRTELAQMHTLLASEPHVAGSPGDAREIERIAKAFVDFGLTVEIDRLELLLPRPKESLLEIVDVEFPATPDGVTPPRRGVFPLAITEPNLAVDPQTAHPDLNLGWNAWSGSGDVEAAVVYVNYGTREDFAQLATLGIETKGKIALARYGGNFRGYKAKFAQDAGCSALVIFTDPSDTGSGKGGVWPESGGWANDTCIQRGSLLTLPYPGDPGTPGRKSVPGIVRAPTEELLPKIPVQPIGYAAAREILSRMQGAIAPTAWIGGLPCEYRLTSDASASAAGVRLHLKIEQERIAQSTANVIGRLEGAVFPEEFVVVGCHHDAWCFGAADPLAGTMCLMESARNFALLAKEGHRPDRSIVFAAWGAEEYGIFGSTEWVEGMERELGARCVAYINLDMAAMGLKPSFSASPWLQDEVLRAASAVPAPDGDGTALDLLPRVSPEGSARAIGELGGGSDHVAFWCRALVPSVAIGSGGSLGNSYHSNYDTVAWYQATVGSDYRAAELVTRLTNAFVARMSDASVAGFGAERSIEVLSAKLTGAARKAQEAKLPFDVLEALALRVDKLGTLASRCDEALRMADAKNQSLSAATRAALCSCRLAFKAPSGLAGRPWFSNLYAATDRFTGYGTSVLPEIAEAIEDLDAERIAHAAERLHGAISRLESALQALRASVESRDSQ